MYSLTARDLYAKYHDIHIGLYTIGPCEAGPHGLDPGTSIGRYSSIYYTVRVITRDYPAGWAVSERNDNNEDKDHGIGSKDGRKVLIGNDVFIGHNAIILPSVGLIGDGAFVGAGSVVKSDVPPYAVAMGNPARVVRYRFSEETIKRLLAERWWENSIEVLGGRLEEFSVPLEAGAHRWEDGIGV